MNIKEAVDVIDSCWSQGIVGECAESWQTLKASVLAQQSTNKPTEKCLGCSNFLPSCTHQFLPDSEDCLKNFERYP